MLFWLIVITICFGLFTFCRAVEYSFNQWRYGRANRKTLDRWRCERR